MACVLERMMPQPSISLVQQDSVRVVEVALPSPLPAWAQSLDVGEIEVIVLGQQQAADWVLIDNEHARRAARQVGLPPQRHHRVVARSLAPRPSLSPSL